MTSVAALVATIAIQTSQPAAPEGQRVAVERFVAACVNGEITSAGLRAIERGDLPAALLHRFRNRAARHYRFDERPASYLVIESDPRPDARYHTTCSLATPVDGPWSLFSAVMNHMRPGSVPPLARGRRPRGSRTIAASNTNDEAGYTIQAVRAGRYTLLQTLQFRTKRDGAAPDPAAAPVPDPR